MMMKFSVLAFACGLSHLLKQDPCAGCDTGLEEAYQKCAKDYGNPCALELNDAGAKNSDGKKKDYGCCLKKEKHDRCLQCKSMDCSHDTCNVNKHYYNTYEHAAGEMTKDKEQAEWEAQSKEGAGWGL